MKYFIFGLISAFSFSFICLPNISIAETDSAKSAPKRQIEGPAPASEKTPKKTNTSNEKVKKPGERNPPEFKEATEIKHPGYNQSK